MSSPIFDNEIRKQIRAMKLRVRKVFSGEGGGAIRARGLGAGHDFHDHKPYSEGDDFRYIDWNLFGRHGELHIKRFRQETNLEFFLILDRSASMSLGKPSKDVFCRRLASALSACFAGPAQPVQIVLAERGLPRVGPQIRNSNDLEVAMNDLESLSPAQGQLELPLGDGLPRTAQNRVVFYLGDFLQSGNLIGELASLRSSQCEVQCVLICAEEERAPKLHGRVHLWDIESNAELRLTLNPKMLDRYVELFEAHLEDQQRLARAAGLKLFIVGSESTLEQAIISLVTHGGLTT